MYKILKKEQVNSVCHLFEVEAPNIAKKAKSGQFIILRQREVSERIPLTIADYSREKGTLTIIFQVAGHSTRELAKCEAGDMILDLVGPLGLPSEIENYGTVVCIGGGVGIAPMYPITRDLKKAGNKVYTIIGARSSDLLFWRKKMAEVSDELIIITDDGSEGRKAFPNQVVTELIEKEKIDHIWAIGPMIMMKVVANATRPYGIKTIVSMNPIMVDGTGMCGACRVAVGDETKFACVDGPEFDGHQVDFELAMKRAAFFKAKEQEALSAGQNGGGCKCQK